MSEDKQRGRNAALLDMAQGRILTPSELVAGPDYVEGYQDGQDHVLFERSLLREDFDAAPVV